MRIDIITLFPEYLAPLSLSLLGKAQEDGLLSVHIHQLREFARDRHQSVDDTPCGGGAGMVMMPEPWALALANVVDSGPDGITPQIIFPGPSGTPHTQAASHELAREPWLIFGCGRYEGIDERVYDFAATLGLVCHVSLGDYVLNGGEVAVLAIVESVGRLLPGVVGNAESLVEESHEGGLLEYPVYTKPSSWRGNEVPEVLMSGHHARIARWRQDQRVQRTVQRRPDLWASYVEAGSADPGDMAAAQNVSQRSN